MKVAAAALALNLSLFLVLLPHQSSSFPRFAAPQLLLQLFHSDLGLSLCFLHFFIGFVFRHICFVFWSALGFLDSFKTKKN